MMKTAVLFLAAGCLIAGSVQLLDDSLQISVGQYRYVSFRVLEVQGAGTRVVGSIEVNPDTAEVELILLSLPDFSRWNSGGTADTLDHTTTGPGEFQLDVPGFGDFVLLVSNRGNYHPVTVALSAELHFRGDGIQYESLPMAFRLMLVILAGGVVVAAVLLAIRKMRA